MTRRLYVAYGLLAHWGLGVCLGSLAGPHALYVGLICVVLG